MTAFLATVFGGFAAIVAIIVWRGYVTSVLWGWFAVPVFNVPEISIPVAVGIAGTVAMLTHEGAKTEADGFWESVAIGFFGPLVLLGICWIAKLWV